MTTSKAAHEALESRDWGGATAATASGFERNEFIFSIRVDPALATWVAAEVERRGPGTTPSEVIRDAIAGAKARSESEETVTMRLSDLHSAIDRAVRPLQDA